MSTEGKSRKKCDDEHHLKILIPNYVIGAIMGPDGSIIRYLESDTGTKISISRNYDFYPGTEERVCLISGNMDSVLSANYFIMENISNMANGCGSKYNKRKMQTRARQVKMLIPQFSTPRLIGKSGIVIEKIKAESETFIQISQKQHGIKFRERCVSIVGDITSKNNACQMILRRIANDTNVHHYLNVSYADVDFPVPNSCPTGPAYATNIKMDLLHSRNNEESFDFDSSSDDVDLSEIDSISPLRNISQLFDKIKFDSGNSSFTEKSISEASRAVSFLKNKGLLDVCFAMLREFHSPGILERITTERKLVIPQKNTLPLSGVNNQNWPVPIHNIPSLVSNNMSSSEPSLRNDINERVSCSSATSCVTPLRSIRNESIASYNLNKSDKNINVIPVSFPTVKKCTRESEHVEGSNLDPAFPVFSTRGVNIPVKYPHFTEMSSTNTSAFTLSNSNDNESSDIFERITNERKFNVGGVNSQNESVPVSDILSLVPNTITTSDQPLKNYTNLQVPYFSSASCVSPFGDISNESMHAYKPGRNPNVMPVSYPQAKKERLEVSNRSLLHVPFFSQIPTKNSSDCVIPYSNFSKSPGILDCISNKRETGVLPQAPTFPAVGVNNHDVSVDVYDRPSLVSNTIATSLPSHRSYNAQMPYFSSIYSAAPTRGLRDEKIPACDFKKPIWNHNFMPVSYPAGKRCVRDNEHVEGVNFALSSPVHPLRDATSPVMYPRSSQMSPVDNNAYDKST